MSNTHTTVLTAADKEAKRQKAVKLCLEYPTAKMSKLYDRYVKVPKAQVITRESIINEMLTELFKQGFFEQARAFLGEGSTTKTGGCSDRGCSGNKSFGPWDPRCKHGKSKFREMISEGLSKNTFDHSNNLIVGNVQCGKTKAIASVGYIHTLVENMPVVVITRNRTKEGQQMIDKFARIAFETKKSLKKSGNFSYVPDMEILSLQTDKDSTIKEALSGKTKKMIVAMANATQLGRLNTIMDNLKTDITDLVLIVDEADDVAYSDPTVQKQGEYEKLKDRAFRRFEVTATCQDILVGNVELLNTNIITINPSEHYKGHQNLEYVEVEGLGYAPAKDTTSHEDPAIQSIIDDIENTLVFGEKYSATPLHPKIVLYKGSRYVKDHQQFAEDFTSSRDKWVVVTEDGEKTCIFSQALQGTTVTIGSETRRDTTGSGTFEFVKVDIQWVLQWFLDNGGAKKFPNIIIKAGEIAGRSRSYVSSNGKWHLTHQILLPYKTDSIPDLLQACRLIHNRPDTIPLKLYGSSQTISDIQKGYLMSEEQLERLQNKEKELLVHKEVRKESWNEEKIPKARICNSNREEIKSYRPKITSGEDDGWDLGWDLSIYEELSSDTKTMSISDEEDDIEYTILEEESFGKNTKKSKIYKDVVSILIENNKYNIPVSVSWVTKKLLETKYQDHTIQKIYGPFWSTISQMKLAKTHKITSNSLLYWKDNKGLQVMLTK